MKVSLITLFALSSTVVMCKDPCRARPKGSLQIVDPLQLSRYPKSRTAGPRFPQSPYKTKQTQTPLQGKATGSTTAPQTSNLTQPGSVIPKAPENPTNPLTAKMPFSWEPKRQPVGKPSNKRYNMDMDRITCQSKPAHKGKGEPTPPPLPTKGSSRPVNTRKTKKTSSNPNV